MFGFMQKLALKRFQLWLVVVFLNIFFCLEPKKKEGYAKKLKRHERRKVKIKFLRQSWS